MAGLGHNALSGASVRLAKLFETNIGKPISRDQVQAEANQLDYMKRLRRNGGARDILDQKGIALFWGVGDSYVINKLGLGPVSDKEFIAYRPRNDAEYKLIKNNGHGELVWP